MAKRLIKWTLDSSILKAVKVVENLDGAEVDILAEFDLIEIFPTFLTMPEVPKQLIVYGTKQKLSDTGASDKEAEGKIDSAKAKWDELVAGKWTGGRVNATGAAENKRVVGEAKEIAKVISLQGLMMKKTMAEIQLGKGMTVTDPFTEDDQAKLDEFLIMAVEEAKKAMKS